MNIVQMLVNEQKAEVWQPAKPGVYQKKVRELEKIVCAGKERKVGLVSLFKALNAKMTVIFNLMIE